MEKSKKSGSFISEMGPTMLLIVSCFGFGFLGGLYNTNRNDSAIMFENNGQQIIRTYEAGSDKILVKQGDKYFVSLDKYLSGIEDKGDRNIEKAKIEKLVDN